VIERKDRVNRHTESSLVDLFGRKGEDREYLDQDLDHPLSHRGCGRNLGINLESTEESLDAFEDID
jgi:hypothetical protein